MSEVTYEDVEDSDLVRVTIKTKTGYRILHRRKSELDKQPSKTTSRISAKNPFRPESLAVHGTELAETIEQTGHRDWEPTDNGFMRPKFDSMRQWRRYLSATGRHDRDGFE